MMGGQDPPGGPPNTDSDETSLPGKADLQTRKVLVGWGRLDIALRRGNRA